MRSYYLMPHAHWLLHNYMMLVITSFFPLVRSQTLLTQTWYPTTVATNSWHYKELLARYLSDTSDTTASLSYQLHDFGYQGATSVEVTLHPLGTSVFLCAYVS